MGSVGYGGMVSYGAPSYSEANAVGPGIKACLLYTSFHGSTVTIAKSQKIRAADITEEEIEARVRMAASDLKTVVKNGQTGVLKPNLDQIGLQYHSLPIFHDSFQIGGRHPYHRFDFLLRDIGGPYFLRFGTRDG